MKLRRGQLSLLVGGHQFIIHPIMVAIGWRYAYGFWPRGWRTIVAIIVHDWGYWWCDDMDGDTGKLHPLWALMFCGQWFSGVTPADWHDYLENRNNPRARSWFFWAWFLGGHSRYYAQIAKMEVSPLMLADKLATALLPRWLYALQVWSSGEYKEYVAYSHSVGHTEVPSSAWGYSGWLLNHWREKFVTPIASRR